jgi:plastocyanin
VNLRSHRAIGLAAIAGLLAAFATIPPATAWPFGAASLAGSSPVPIAVDEAAAAGIAESTQTAASLTADINSDGWPDILLSRDGVASAQLFLNNRNGTFSESQPGTFVKSDRLGCAAADVNGDGRADIFCSIGAHHGTWVKTSQLWVQQSDGSFVDQGSSSGVADPLGRDRGPLFVDVNGDGLLDLFVSADPERPDGLPTPNRLFINQGNGIFRDTPSFGLDQDMGGGCIRTADVNGDGRADLLVCGSSGNRPLRLFENVGGTHFVDVTAPFGLSGEKPSGALLVDLTGLGSPDLVEIFSNTLEVRRLVGGVFQPPSFTLSLSSGAAVAAGDVNGDGLPDLYVVQGKAGTANAPDVMLLNGWNGSTLTFTQMTIPETTLGVGQGVYPLDYDHNGLTDFLVLNGDHVNGPVQLIAFFPSAQAVRAAGGESRPTLGQADRSGPRPGLAAPASPAKRGAAPSVCSSVWGTFNTPTFSGGGGVDLRSIAGVSSVDGWTVGATDGTQPPIERWNGSQWSSVPNPDLGPGGSGFNSVGVNSATDVLAVGFHLNGKFYETVGERWDGTSWTRVTSANPGSGSDVLIGLSTINSTLAWGAGLQSDGVTLQTLIEKWNGTQWTSVPSPDAPGSVSNALLAVDAVSSTEAWAVGYAWDQTSGADQPLIEHTTDGMTWQIASGATLSGSDGGVLTGITVISPSDVWSVGLRMDGSAFQPLAEHWNGSSWAAVPVPAPAPGFAILRGVAALGSGNVWAVGTSFDQASDSYRPLLEHFDGTGWSTVSGPLPSGDNQIIGTGTVTGSDMWAIGRNQATGQAQAERVCPVGVTESGFSSRSITVAQGSAVNWQFPTTDAVSHSVTDGTGMGLFDSGLRAPGGSFTFAFQAAGAYTVVDTASTNKMTVKIPVQASPGSGGVTTTFTIVWSATAPDAGYVFDIQIMKPGATQWAKWKTGQTTTSATFVPDAGAGTYSFRARLRNLSNNKATGYSTPASITVS